MDIILKKKSGLSILAIALAAVLCISFCCTQAEAADTKTKVIMDSDMVECFDDGVAMLLLAKSPKIDLLGVTFVGGNTWSREAAAYGLRQLEAIGMENQVPLFLGNDEVIRKGRLANIHKERETFGVGHDSWIGAFARPVAKSWQAEYQKRYGITTNYKFSDKKAEDFIIEQIKKHPGEVLLLAIGPCGNINRAIEKDPSIVPMAKGIVYMGGAFFIQGNVTPAAEFNWWFDPEAARKVVRSPFKSQTVVGLDVCEKIVLDGPQFLKVKNTVTNPIIAEMFQRTYDGLYAPNPGIKMYIWDAIAAAIIIDPTLVTESKVLPIDVNDVYSQSYGQSLAYLGKGPTGSQKAEIILTVDEDRLWKMILDLTSSL